jgi:hypothetical protein
VVTETVTCDSAVVLSCATDTQNRKNKSKNTIAGFKAGEEEIKEKAMEFFLALCASPIDI